MLYLSEAPDEILMWSHYAEYHKGFCSEYNLDEISPLQTMAKPVKYTDVYPSLSVKNLPAGATESFLMSACSPRPSNGATRRNGEQ